MQDTGLVQEEEEEEVEEESFANSLIVCTALCAVAQELHVLRKNVKLHSY